MSIDVDLQWPMRHLAASGVPIRSRRAVRLWLAAAAVTAGLGSGGACAAGSSGFEVQQVDIIDRQGFEKPMLAATLMLPAGWQHRSDLRWTPTQRCGLPFGMTLQAQSADGLSAIQIVPGEVWGATTMPIDDGCRRAAFRDAQSYLQDWVRQNRPGARWLDYRPMPKRIRPPHEVAQPGMQIRTWSDSGQALIGYELNGKPMREVVAADFSFTASVMQMMQTQTQSLFGESRGVFSWRAPEGELEFRRVDAVIGSMRHGYEWASRVQEGLGKIAADNQRTAAAVANIHAQIGMDTIRVMARRGEDARLSREQVNEMWNRGVAQRDSADDRMHRERIRALREVEHYSDPARPSGVAELPNNYRHAFALRNGHYVLTDDPNFDARRALGVDGRRLELAPR
ncbi:MAG: hypothetical protein U5L03_17085 [Burkholderiaceae bacterium]|nr:hypothetical protein [Burkholderiaceae bacterium]